MGKGDRLTLPIQEDAKVISPKIGIIGICHRLAYSVEISYDAVKYKFIYTCAYVNAYICTKVDKGIVV